MLYVNIIYPWFCGRTCLSYKLCDSFHLLSLSPSQADFPVVYGCDFDRALQALVCQFLSRLEDLLPVPELKQVERKPREM